MIRTIMLLLIIFVVSLLFSSEAPKAYEHIEAATPGIIGAILGGLTASVSIILSVILTVASSSSLPVNKGKFESFFKSLKTDMLVLVGCLAASVLLPYLRVTGVPFINYPLHALAPMRDTFYTAAELTVVVVSISIIAEVIKVMFSLFSYYVDSLSSQNEEDKGAD